MKIAENDSLPLGSETAFHKDHEKYLSQRMKNKEMLYGTMKITHPQKSFLLLWKMPFTFLHFILNKLSNNASEIKVIHVWSNGKTCPLL